MIEKILKYDAEKMSLNKLYRARFKAMMDGDVILVSIYDDEISKRNPEISISGYSSLQDEPWYLEDPEREDRRKEVLESKAEPEDYLPF